MDSSAPDMASKRKRHPRLATGQVRTRRWACVGVLTTAGLGLVLITPSWAAFPGANGRIGYSIYEQRGDEVELFMMATVRPDGSRRRMLPTDIAEGMAFSPTGNRIAFSRMPTVTDAVIATAGPLGRDRRRLTARRYRVQDSSPAWSPTGREVVFTRNELGSPSQLWIHGASGERLLTQGREPSWSVNGGIAFEQGRAIYVIRPDGTGLRQVAPRGFSPDWSPDGKRLTFAVRGDIVAMRLGGSRLRRLTRGRAFDSDPAFSPDGRRIVFVRNGKRIITMTTRGGDRDTIATGFIREGAESWLSDPDWQPRPVP